MPAAVYLRAALSSQSHPGRSHRIRDNLRAPSLLSRSVRLLGSKFPIGFPLPLPNPRSSPSPAENPLPAAALLADPHHTSRTIPSSHESENAAPGQTR